MLFDTRLVSLQQSQIFFRQHIYKLSANNLEWPHYKPPTTDVKIERNGVEARPLSASPQQRDELVHCILALAAGQLPEEPL